jgi:hypothetical protein
MPISTAIGTIKIPYVKLDRVGCPVDGVTVVDVTAGVAEPVGLGVECVEYDT